MKEYKFKINGNDYDVSINKVIDGTADVIVNGATFNVEFEGMGTTKKKNTVISQVAPAPVTEAPAAKPAIAKPVVAASQSAVKSPLPGVILELKVKVGETIKVGQRLLVLEAMKMENNIDSDRAGVIQSIKVGKGDSVLEGDVLLTIE